MSLNHQNIVRVYGSLKRDNGFYGILMELADRGSLKQKSKDLSFSQKVYVAICVCHGVSYLHSKRVVHGDLSPDNVLLFGPVPIAKISDFGTSKEIQTMSFNSCVTGTLKYSAPELMNPGQYYNRSVDIYSLAIILYELFSELDPFPECTTMFQVAGALQRKQRPKFPHNFPAALKKVIKKGWSNNPKDRPEVQLFLTELKKLDKLENCQDSPLEEITPPLTTTVTATIQTAEIHRNAMPVPFIAMQWKDEMCELENSKECRIKMIDNLKDKSNLYSMINTTVLKAMEYVPRCEFH